MSVDGQANGAEGLVGGEALTAGDPLTNLTYSVGRADASVEERRLDAEANVHTVLLAIRTAHSEKMQISVQGSAEPAVWAVVPAWNCTKRLGGVQRHPTSIVTRNGIVVRNPRVDWYGPEDKYLGFRVKPAGAEQPITTFVELTLALMDKIRDETPLVLAALEARQQQFQEWASASGVAPPDNLPPVPTPPKERAPSREAAVTHRMKRGRSKVATVAAAPTLSLRQVRSIEPAPSSVGRFDQEAVVAQFKASQRRADIRVVGPRSRSEGDTTLGPNVLFVFLQGAALRDTNFGMATVIMDRGIVKGNLSCGTLHLARGIVEGNISCDTLYLAGGLVTGDVQCAGDAVLQAGTIYGDVRCRGWRKDRALVHGDVSSTGNGLPLAEQSGRSQLNSAPTAPGRGL